jgi:peptide/nickel transport system substrate-binding protein
MKPERLASSDPFKPNNEMVGSGPYSFKVDEYIAGAKAAYERFDRYKPRENGTTEWTAAPKITHFDRVEWTTILDASTAAAALRRVGGIGGNTRRWIWWSG